jgi:hypothetical protein
MQLRMDMVGLLLSISQRKWTPHSPSSSFLLDQSLYSDSETLLMLKCRGVEAAGSDAHLLAQCLVESASAARRAGRTSQGLSLLSQLRSLLVSQAELPQSGADNAGRDPLNNWWRRMSRPDSKWLLEEARLLWLQGQRELALGVTRRLVESMKSMLQLSAGADAKNADTDMALEAQSLWLGLIASASLFH